MVNPLAHDDKYRDLPDFLQSHPLTGWLTDKGWFYHDHQLETFDKTQAGKDVLLFAPTGAGKTLSGFLPSIVDLTAKEYPEHQLHTLYISPLKALAVDVHRNLMQPIKETGMEISVETRTGDTPASKRQRQKTKPPQMLMTTPESLALLLSYEEAPQYFANLRYIIIDELHALMHSKRGDLMSLNLARLGSLAPKAQRIGLSATVSDPKNAKDYLCRARKGVIVKVQHDVKPEIEILLGSERMPWSGHMAHYAIPDVYKRIVKAKMSVVFVNTRAQAELMFQNLWACNDDNLRIAVHHGSLEKELRRKVEDQMSLGKLDCVVATASLDLGLDWANVDLVVQVGAPKGVSRLLQRIGRSNHRLDEPSHAVLVPSNRFEYLECLAAKEAIAQGDLDGTLPQIGGLDVLAQHITGVACSGAFDPELLHKEIITAWPYKDVSYDDFMRVLAFVRNGGYALKTYERYARLVENDDGTLQIANKRFVQQYRMNIGTIVEAHMLKVKLKMRTLGKIEEWFIQGLSPGDTFIFGGQVLCFEGLSDQGVQVSKTKGKQPKIPSYAGGRMPLSTQLSLQVRCMLNRPKQWKNYPEQVREWLQLHDMKSTMPPEDGLLVETFERGSKKNKRHFMVAYTFEGRNAHQTLGFLLSKRMQRFGYKPLGFVATDYAMALWSMNPIDRVDHLFDQDLMTDDLHEWLMETPLLKKNFRDVAVISGLIERRYPGQQKTGRQVTFSSDLIYDVLRKYEPDHILLQAAQDDALGGLIDLKRLGDMLARVEGKIIHEQLEAVSPLAVPLILEISKETINKKDVGEFYLQEFEAELLEEAGLE
ncbi:MAG: ligase-associated DNA damage response DEXH box helicase [Bdellovibrionales bacterium]